MRTQYTRGAINKPISTPMTHQPLLLNPNRPTRRGIPDYSFELNYRIVYRCSVTHFTYYHIINVRKWLHVHISLGNFWNGWLMDIGIMPLNSPGGSTLQWDEVC